MRSSDRGDSDRTDQGRGREPKVTQVGASSHGAHQRKPERDCGTEEMLSAWIQP